MYVREKRNECKNEMCRADSLSVLFEGKFENFRQIASSLFLGNGKGQKLRFNAVGTLLMPTFGLS